MTYELKAYPTGPIAAKGWSIEPSTGRQDWMSQTMDQAALRCLPLLMAGQAGWVIKCPVGFSVVWNGKRPRGESLQFKFEEDAGHHSTQVVSNFGLGIVTFAIPWLFRTNEGLGLLVRGPANYFKDNAVPLEGIVESDWAPYTFTMNWKIIQPKRPVWFKKGDPICMITPFPLDLLEKVRPSFASFDDDPDLFDEFLHWRDHRKKQMQEATAARSSEGLFRLDYLKGLHPDGTRTREHRSSLKLAAFEAMPARDPCGGGPAAAT